jgi:hypothetical protein
LSAGVVAWLEDEVDAWIEARIAARDEQMRGFNAAPPERQVRTPSGVSAPHKPKFNGSSSRLNAVTSGNADDDTA